MMRQLFLIVCAGMCLQMQAQDEIVSTAMAAQIHQDSIDVSSIVVVYDYECQTQDADGKAVTDKMKVCLQIGQHSTRSYPYRKYRRERQWIGDGATDYMDGYDFLDLDELPQFRAESYCFMPEVWVNYPLESVTVRDAIVPTIYVTQEKKENINWVLSDDTVKIGGYLCKTAQCQLHGRQWTVHYTEDIPTSAGPWKLYGQPGLILDAVADGGVHRFTLDALQHVVSPIYFETNVITTKTSEKQLIKNCIKTFGNRLYPNSPQYYITDLSTADVIFDNDGALINGIYVNKKTHVYQPLELK